MTLVVDASVAVKWLVREHDSNLARSLFEVSDPLIAPDWLMIEAASSFWKKVKRSELLEIHAHRHLEDMPEFFSRLYPSRELNDGALSLAFRLKHPVYDCLYLELARQTSCQMITADTEFVQRLAGTPYAAMVVPLSEFC
ncbi:type II toxin-antitoxin system VapC family toxin [Blastomonas sp.]|uniref:type II toxin-antitoxin system VapC family toxin n=1 Tax=Blastomonas sp. TaxID=1909299 RepID=UPI003593C5EF